MERCIVQCFVTTLNTKIATHFIRLTMEQYVCIQGSQRRTHEPVTQYDVGEFHVLECGYGPAAGKASGVVIAFRTKLFSFKHLARVYSPPSELLGRVGAIRLKRGDVDFLVIINAYFPVNPHKTQEKQYCNKVWAWIYHVLSQAPSRCAPILCMDANGRVGNGILSPCFILFRG